MRCPAASQRVYILENKMTPKNQENGQVERKAIVEVLQKSKSTLASDDIERLARDFLRTPGVFENLKNASTDSQNGLNHSVEEFKFTNFDAGLAKHVSRISVVIPKQSRRKEKYEDEDFTVNVYRLRPNGPSPDDLGEEESERVTASLQWELPNEDFDEQWENLVFETDLKETLLSYANTLVELSVAGVNPSIVSFNRLILLHGPPGSGKTSLCKALAQKVAIRQIGSFQRAVLIEINSHSLFSRWFSESGKLVMKMFERINLLLEDQHCFVYLLIDEVESLASSRRNALAGSEPSDAIRVVNALLTQIDLLKRYPNVLVLTTSNISESIDPAFLDRADIVQHVDLPGSFGAATILSSCVQELLSKGVLKPEGINESEIRCRVQNLGCKAQGLSGRALRKLPVLALSHCFKNGPEVALESFFRELDSLVEKRTVTIEDITQKIEKLEKISS